MVVFNSIEFWDGTNPIAMNEGDKEIKQVKGKKSSYRITATKNKYHIEVIEGKHLGAITELVYEANDQSWNMIKGDGEKVKLTSLKQGFRQVHMPNGTTIKVYENMNKKVMRNYLYDRFDDYKRYNLALANGE